MVARTSYPTPAPEVLDAASVARHAASRTDSKESIIWSVDGRTTIAGMLPNRRLTHVLSPERDR